MIVYEKRVYYQNVIFNSYSDPKYTLTFLTKLFNI